MKLLILLLCLGFERYFRIGALLKRFHWFDFYSKTLMPYCVQLAKKEAWAGFCMMTLPLVLALAVFYFLFADLAFGLFGIIFSFVILLYCLGPDDLYHQLQVYFKALDDGDEQVAANHYQEIVGSLPPASASDAARQLSSAIFIQSNERFFAVIFWFIILGPIGAMLYRVTTLLNHRASTYPDSMEPILAKSLCLQAVMDWLPIRLVTLLFIMVGNFHAAFPKWWKGVLSGWQENREWLLDCCMAALLSKPLQKASIAENKRALAMLDSALVVVLVLIAIFTLGAWIY